MGFDMRIVYINGPTAGADWTYLSIYFLFHKNASYVQIFFNALLFSTTHPL